MNVLEARFGSAAGKGEAVNDHALPHGTDDQAARNIAELVAAIYASATVGARVRLLEHLLRPLGALSILVVADGIFGRIWFRHGWCEFRIRPEDIAEVRYEHVAALVEHVLQRSADTVYLLPDLLGAMPALDRDSAVDRLWAVLERGPRGVHGSHALHIPVQTAVQAPARRAAAN